MYHVFLDFEMNPTPRQDRTLYAKLQSEIVEIGAVKLDENYQLIDRFSTYVKPELNTITKKITELTGITDAKVEKAPLLEDAIWDFADWIGEEPTRVYSWSESDRRQLTRECRFKDIGIPNPFFRWMDFQRVYTRLVGLSARSALSLKNALGVVEADFSGSQHSAVADAENSASLLTLVHDRAAFEERIKFIKELLSPSSAPQTTLGALFGDKLSQLSGEESE